MPVRNGESSLPRAIESLLGQTFEDFELVISDNASRDSTEDVCRHYVSQDSRVKYFRNPENLGLVANYNHVYRLTSGRYFKWATHDDWIEPEFLAECLDFLEASPRSVACSTAVSIHNHAGEVVGAWSPQGEFPQGERGGRARALILQLGEPFALYGLIRSQALRQTDLMGSFLGADRVLLLSLVLQGEIRIIPKYLYHYTWFRPPDRVYSVYNDPANMGRLPLRTWVLMKEQLELIARSGLPVKEGAAVAHAVLVRHGLRSRRLLAAEAYNSARVLAQRATGREAARP